MRLSFFKMQGCGNDYIFLDARHRAVKKPEVLAPLLSDRHTGIGGDGLVCLYPSRRATVKMKMFNADGSEGALCGNAARCVGRYLWDSADADTRLTRTYSLDTPAGLLPLRVDSREGAPAVSVCLGQARFSGEKGSAASLADGVFHGEPAAWLPLFGRRLRVFGVSVGNPHGVVFADENPSFFPGLFPPTADEAAKSSDDSSLCASLAALPLSGISAALTETAAFPAGVNLEYVLPLGENRFAVRVFERGSGETRSCGSGACAVAACAVRAERADPEKPVTLLFPGGILTVERRKNALWLSGAAEYVFRGEIDAEFTPKPRLTARYPLC